MKLARTLLVGTTVLGALLPATASTAAARDPQWVCNRTSLCLYDGHNGHTRIATLDARTLRCGRNNIPAAAVDKVSSAYNRTGNPIALQHHEGGVDYEFARLDSDEMHSFSNPNHNNKVDNVYVYCR